MRHERRIVKLNKSFLTSTINQPHSTVFVQHTQRAPTVARHDRRAVALDSPATPCRAGYLLCLKDEQHDRRHMLNTKHSSCSLRVVCTRRRLPNQRNSCTSRTELAEGSWAARHRAHTEGRARSNWNAQIHIQATGAKDAGRSHLTLSSSPLRSPSLASLTYPRSNQLR